MNSTGRFTTELRHLMARSYDTCRSCGAKLPREVAGYAGYDCDGAPLYVGDCCKPLISELATHVYWWWEVDKRCDPEAKLWRYMDFAKFVSMLEARAIYFSRADLLGDRYEGAMGVAERREEWDGFYLDFFRRAVETVPGQTQPMPAETVEREAQRLLREFATTGEMVRRQSFVNCWHMNSGESEALWRLYCPPPTAGVAIQTTAGLLLGALGDNPNIRLGRVQYVDFRKAFAGLHDRVFWKRASLSHEAEVRAVVQRRDQSTASGLTMSVDLDRLLVSVVPSPFAGAWFSDLLRTVLSRFNVRSTVNRSELLAEPFF